MAEGWDVPEQGRRPRHRWFEQRDRSGGLLRHGTSPFTPQCVHRRGRKSSCPVGEAGGTQLEDSLLSNRLRSHHDRSGLQ